jgi:hypothetical protein
MRRIIYNDDSQGVNEARPGHVRADLEAWVDRPCRRIPIDTYAWCIAFPDICMHHTKVGEVYGERFPEPPNNAAMAISELHQEGTDVLHVVCTRARRHGVEIVASVRMNDTHGMFADPLSPNMSRFLLAHPDYVIRRQDGIPERALDYSYPEVREHRLAILRELANDYDIDGLELDFTRWAKLFAREEAPFKIHVMTDFLGQVRQILDQAAARRGCPRLTLGVQVLESLYLCHLSGLDPRTWVARDWLDYLIQCDFNCTNPQTPAAEFAAFCAPSRCTHHVRMGNMMGGAWDGPPHVTSRPVAQYKGNPGYGGMVLTPEEARGAAANAYGFGADGIGLWNICCNLGQRHKAGATGPDRRQFQEDMFAWIQAVADPDAVWAGRRVYHFVPLYKRASLPVRNYPVNGLLTSPTGAPTQIVTFRPESVGHRQMFRFLCADGVRPEPVKGVLRLRMLNSDTGDEFRLDLNGVPLAAASMTVVPEPDNTLPAVWYEVEMGQNSCLRGDNELGITPQRLARRDAPPYMEELIVELETDSD